MSRNAGVYGLRQAEGALGRAAARAVTAGPLAESPGRRPLATLLPHPRVEAFLSDAQRSLSLFVPGLTHLLQGRRALGLLFLSWLVFLGALGWSVLGNMDRLVPTLGWLGRSSSIAFGTVAVVYGLGAAVHIAAVWTALGPPSTTRPPRARHPLGPAIASFLVPGWGQILNGDRVRASLCLGCCWLVAGAWIASSNPATALLSEHFPAVGSLEQSMRAPIVAWFAKWTLPLLLWCMAVYDAAASAVGRRQRR